MKKIKIKFPKISIPKIGLLKVKVPKVALPKIGLPKRRSPKADSEDAATVNLRPEESSLIQEQLEPEKPVTYEPEGLANVASQETLGEAADEPGADDPDEKYAVINAEREAEWLRTYAPRDDNMPTANEPKNRPKIALPKIGMPKFSLPALSVPKVSIPKLRRPKKVKDIEPATIDILDEDPVIQRLSQPDETTTYEPEGFSHLDAREPIDDDIKDAPEIETHQDEHELVVEESPDLPQDTGQESKPAAKTFPKLAVPKIGIPKIGLPKIGVPKIKLPTPRLSLKFDIKKLLAVFLLLATFGAVLTIAFVPDTDITLPGTQPGQVQTLASPTVCFACHEDQTANRAPATLWRGSMHSLAAVDPLFLAALSASNEDLKDSGSFCIRCHSPRAFLAGRASPADGSKLDQTDKWGVTCDFCHRLVDPQSNEGKELAPDVPGYSNGMYVVSNDTNTKRGPYKDSIAPHNTKFSQFHRQSELCGTCHDVTNPINDLPLERTYSEWKQSWYAEQGESGNCQSCHMESVPGYAVGPYYNYGNQYREFLPNHNFSGGSTWIFDTIPYFEPNANKKSLAEGKARGIKKLKETAQLEIASNRYGFKNRVTVRVINKTGHKLPTGFPEGRRVWLNVKAFNKNSKLIYESGRYDYNSADLLKDDSIKVYEAKPGIAGKGPSFHFALNNEITKDNRIPPKGFTNEKFNSAGAQVIGYEYKDGQYWDDTTYLVPTESTRVEVTLYYQTTSKEYIEFLRDNDKKSPYGKKLYEVWEKTGKSAPVEMASAELAIEQAVILNKTVPAPSATP